MPCSDFVLDVLVENSSELENNETKEECPHFSNYKSDGFYNLVRSWIVYLHEQSMSSLQEPHTSSHSKQPFSHQNLLSPISSFTGYDIYNFAAYFTKSNSAHA